MATECIATIAGVCFSRPPISTGDPILGFADYLSALALLVLVFNSTDHVYRFRVTVSALPIQRITIVAAFALGVGTLLTDLWFAQRWPAPAWGVTKAEIQASFGAVFLATIFSWLWTGFIRPPVFSRRNSQRFYFRTLGAIVRGSDAELSQVALELQRSAESVLGIAAAEHAKARKQIAQDKKNYEPTPAYKFAESLMLIMGNRKLCRHVVAQSPTTAIYFMEEVAKHQDYSPPLGEFCKNVTEEAIRNKDSIIFHEDDLYYGDYVGQIKPFSTAMYGDYSVVERVSGRRWSPLDLDWRFMRKLDGDQFEVYCRIVLSTFKSFVNEGKYEQHSHLIYRALDHIEQGGTAIAYRRDITDAILDTEEYEKLGHAAEFVKDAIKIVSDNKNISPSIVTRPTDTYAIGSNIIDQLSDLSFELIHAAAYIRKPDDVNWQIQHNTVWTRVASRGEGAVWRALQGRLYRLLLNEIKELAKWPNYKGARILGFCLNIFGVEETKAVKMDKREAAFRQLVIKFAKENYLKILDDSPSVAEYITTGRLTYDSENRRLVKSYANTIDKNPHREYLTLKPL